MSNPFNHGSWSPICLNADKVVAHYQPIVSVDRSLSYHAQALPIDSPLSVHLHAWLLNLCIFKHLAYLPVVYGHVPPCSALVTDRLRIANIYAHTLFLELQNLPGGFFLNIDSSCVTFTCHLLALIHVAYCLTWLVFFFSLLANLCALKMSMHMPQGLLIGLFFFQLYLVQYILPHIMGWDCFTSPQPETTLKVNPPKQPGPLLSPDLEWNRW